jgi:hypothetical protein
MAKGAPHAFAVDPGVLAARWATLKQALGWDDRQCREAIAKRPLVALSSYGNQYAGWRFRSGVARNISHFKKESTSLARQCMVLTTPPLPAMAPQ